MFRVIGNFSKNDYLFQTIYFLYTRGTHCFNYSIPRWKMHWSLALTVYYNVMGASYAYEQTLRIT